MPAYAQYSARSFERVADTGRNGPGRCPCRRGRGARLATDAGRRTRRGAGSAALRALPDAGAVRAGQQRRRRLGGRADAAPDGMARPRRRACAATARVRRLCRRGRLARAVGRAVGGGGGARRPGDRRGLWRRAARSASRCCCRRAGRRPAGAGGGCAERLGRRNRPAARAGAGSRPDRDLLPPETRPLAAAGPHLVRAGAAGGHRAPGRRPVRRGPASLAQHAGAVAVARSRRGQPQVRPGARYGAGRRGYDWRGAAGGRRGAPGRAGAGMVSVAALGHGDLYRSGDPGLVVTDASLAELLQDTRRTVWVCGPGLGLDAARAAPRCRPCWPPVARSSPMPTRWAPMPVSPGHCAAAPS